MSTPLTYRIKDSLSHQQFEELISNLYMMNVNVEGTFRYERARFHVEWVAQLASDDSRNAALVKALKGVQYRIQ